MEQFRLYIFRIIAHLFDLEGYLLWLIMIIARRTESVDEGVINAAVNCSHMRPVNLTLLYNPSNSKMSAIKKLFLLCGVFVII